MPASMGKGHGGFATPLGCTGPPRRTISYLRCSPTGRLMASSMFFFASVCLYLAFKAPQPCQPCNLGAVNDVGRQGEVADRKSPPTSTSPAGHDIVLLNKEAGDALKQPEATKTSAKASPKRKFRNPPVPERPVISDEEQALHRLAVIIPYRDRMDNLKVFVPHLSSILWEQKINFAIYVVGQTDLGAFNRGKLCNIGFQIAEKDGYDYVTIHDVDKLPVSANVSYRWPGNTFVHLATCVEQFKYELPYYNFLGGVVMFRMDHYKQFNGMTNIFWGFGAEDDDLWVRIKRRRLKISRAKACDRGRFTSLDHGSSSLYYPKVDYLVNYNLYRQLLKRKRKMENDGLNTLEYKLISKQREALGYVNVTVDVCQGQLGRATVEETGCDGPKPRPPESTSPETAKNS